MANSKISIRKVKKEDESFLLELANDPAVRRYSFEKDLITLKVHKEWFREKLGSPTSVIYIFERDGVKIAQVRFDLEKDGRACIDYSVKPEFRGQGIGVQALKMSLAKLPSDLDTKAVYAVCFESNLASQRVFKKLNFQELEKEKIRNEDCILFSKEVS